MQMQKAAKGGPHKRTKLVVFEVSCFLYGGSHSSLSRRPSSLLFLLIVLCEQSGIASSGAPSAMLLRLLLLLLPLPPGMRQLRRVLNKLIIIPSLGAWLHFRISSRRKGCC